MLVMCILFVTAVTLIKEAL